MKIFLSSASFLPSYGGPAYSISRLATALEETGAIVGLWSPDQSAATTPLIDSLSNLARLTGSLDDALRRFGDPDLIHDNGIWLRHNHRLARIAIERGICRVVSTRGMLEPWAMNHKRLKKKIAWKTYQRADLRVADAHHCTSTTEAANVKRLGLGVVVRVISNGVDLPTPDADFAHRPRIKPRKRTALFIGRLYPIKGLPMLIDAWSRVNPDGWNLVIAGPDEAGHRSELERRVRELGLRKTISFAGAVEGETKTALLRNAELFVLPTYSESFGMAIAEALAYSLPVVTTTGAPWPQLTERACGWRVQPSVDAVADALRSATSIDRATLTGMGERGRVIVSELQWDRIAAEFMELYQSLTHSRSGGAGTSR
ncbi:MAG TPA: glycosyltransferase [Gemmatimonadaceae bacterium]|nr:glycosyltransferase [Gemmatimonadaceae bacterium]